MLTFSNHFVQNVFLLQSLPSHSLFLRFASFFVELYIARLESKDWVLGVQFNPIQSSHTGNKWPRPLFHQNLYSTLNWGFQHIHSYWLAIFYKQGTFDFLKSCYFDHLFSGWLCGHLVSEPKTCSCQRVKVMIIFCMKVKVICAHQSSISYNIQFLIRPVRRKCSKICLCKFRNIGWKRKQSSY